MAKKKKPEETIDLSKPIDLSKIGTPDDPCFGTQYDQRDKDCKICGDIEICAIAQMQNNKIQRELLAKEKDFKDLDEAKYLNEKDAKEAKRLIEKYKSKGYSKLKIKAKLRQDLNLDSDRLKELIKKYYKSNK